MDKSSTAYTISSACRKKTHKFEKRDRFEPPQRTRCSCRGFYGVISLLKILRTLLVLLVCFSVLVSSWWQTSKYIWCCPGADAVGNPLYVVQFRETRTCFSWRHPSDSFTLILTSHPDIKRSVLPKHENCHSSPSKNKLVMRLKLAMMWHFLLKVSLSKLTPYTDTFSSSLQIAASTTSFWSNSSFLFLNTSAGSDDQT